MEFSFLGFLFIMSLQLNMEEVKAAHELYQREAST